MAFPDFVKIATIPRTRLVEVNGAIVKKQFHEYAEKMMIKMFSEKLGFSYQLVFADDEEYGRRLPHSNWTGMVGLLHRKEADLIFHRMTITEDRAEVIESSYPYYMDRMVFATRNLERAVSPGTFLKTFNFQVWITFVACYCIMPIIYNILFESKISFTRIMACKFFGEQCASDKKKYSENILRIFWEIAMTFAKWCYVALVLSFLTFPAMTGVRNIQELAAAVTEGRFQCTASPGSYVTNALLKSGGYSTIIGNNLREDGGTMDFETALQKRGLAKKTAVVASEIDLLHLKEKYFISDDAFLHVVYVIGISKDFCCKRHLDSVIHYIWPSGIYQYLLNKGMLIEEYEILKQAPLVGEQGDSERSLSLEDFEGVFALLACGCVLSITVFFLEIAYSKCSYT